MDKDGWNDSEWKLKKLVAGVGKRKQFPPLRIDRHTDMHGGKVSRQRQNLIFVLQTGTTTITATTGREGDAKIARQENIVDLHSGSDVLFVVQGVGETKMALRKILLDTSQGYASSIDEEEEGKLIGDSTLQQYSFSWPSKNTSGNIDSCVRYDTRSQQMIANG